MARFIENPSVPEAKVQAVIAGKGMKPYAERLQKCGVEILYTQTCNRVGPFVANHADLSCFYGGKGNFLLESGQADLCTALTKIGASCRFLEQDLQANYPQDVLLNCVKLKDFLICNRKTVAAEILQAAEKECLTVIDVPQGYTKCSVCVVNDNAVITEDTAIYRALEKCGIAVLPIQKGNVTLHGFPYGFIGGCGGLISSEMLAFTGNIERHGDYNRILHFLEQNKIKPLCLSDGLLTDIGSILPITESEE